MDKNLINLKIENFLGEIDIFVHYFNDIKKSIEKNRTKLDQALEEIQSKYNLEDCTSEAIDEAHMKVFGTDSLNLGFHLTSFIGGFSIIIFHSFERFLEEIVTILKIRNLDYSIITPSNLSNFNIDKKLESFVSLTKFCPTIKTLKSYDKIEELRLVCHTFKHGSGSSMEQLRKKRPDLFIWPSDFGDKNVRPFSGLDLDLEENDFFDYVKAIKLFFEEVFEYNLEKK